MKVIDHYSLTKGQAIALMIYSDEINEIIRWSETLDYSTGEVPQCIESLITSLIVGQ